MKRLGALVVVLLATATSLSVALAQEPTFAELLEQLLPGMGAERIADRRDAQQRFQDACFKLGAPGNDVERAEACKLIAQKLGPDTAKPARLWLLKQLEFIGREECVEAVAMLFGEQDREIRDAARRALENNPAPGANARLLAALAAGGDPVWRVAVVNSLGFRGDQTSVGPLARLLADKDPTVAAAAANALGMIGGRRAARALGRVKASGELQVRIADAHLRCADKFLREGKTDLALAIYRGLGKPDLPRPIRLGALQGGLRAAGSEAPTLILDLLASDDADARAVAAGHVANVFSPKALQAFAAWFPKLPTSGQVLLVSALAAVGDKTARPVALLAVRSEDEQVRLTGLQALAALGDASVVPVLLETMAAGGNAGGAARESLQRIFGDGVDEAIIAAMQKAEPGLRGTLVDVLEARSAVVAVPSLLKEAAGEDAGVRSRAMRALGNLAGPAEVPAMIALLLSYQPGRERDDAEKAILQVCGRIPEPQNRADPVLAVLTDAGEAERCALLPLLGRLGGEKALAAVHAAMASDRDAVREAGVRALCNWPDASVADELLRLAQSAEKGAHRVMALRAYIRVTGYCPQEQQLAMYKQAMELATRDDERNLALNHASSARHIETLRWVVPYLDSPALATEASRAVVELAQQRELMEPNRAEFLAALRKVTEVCKDAGLVDRAKQYLPGQQ